MAQGKPMKNPVVSRRRSSTAQALSRLMRQRYHSSPSRYPIVAPINDHSSSPILHRHPIVAPINAFPVGQIQFMADNTEPVSTKTRKLKSRADTRNSQQAPHIKRRSKQRQKPRVTTSSSGNKSKSSPSHNLQDPGRSQCCTIKTISHFVCISLFIFAAGAITVAFVFKPKFGGISGPSIPTKINIGDYSDIFEKGLVDKWNMQTGSGGSGSGAAGGTDEVGGIGELSNIQTGSGGSEKVGNTGELPRVSWPSQGNGLQLEVYNALTSNWYQYFNQAMNDWENQSPKSLILANRIVAADSLCTPVTGVVKVCNANYGSTGWRGINEIMVDASNKLTSSVSKMNEHYLLKETDAVKQHTMCHEMGHGWGLDHQDEDFNNPSTGSCMDYVLDPENNQHPNAKDYDILQKMYGAATSGRIRRYHKGRSLHLRSKSKESLRETIPNSQFFSFTDDSHRHRWRLLKENSAVEIHELDLGDGTRILARLLLAENSW